MAFRSFLVIIAIPDTHEGQLDKIEHTALSVFALRADITVNPLDQFVRDDKKVRRIFKPLIIRMPAATIDEDLSLARAIEGGILSALSGGGIVSHEVSVWVGQYAETGKVA